MDRSYPRGTGRCAAHRRPRAGCSLDADVSRLNLTSTEAVVGRRVRAHHRGVRPPGRRRIAGSLASRDDGRAPRRARRRDGCRRARRRGGARAEGRPRSSARRASITGPTARSPTRPRRPPGPRAPRSSRSTRPNATWPAVKRAVTGASIVVYLGHGNGWPSRYRDALYPPTQNGFGLNPVAGGDDAAHQYFGEAAVGQLQLAPNAVVVLSATCATRAATPSPASPRGRATRRSQRVDNYAAGFLRAGRPGRRRRGATSGPPTTCGPAPRARARIERHLGARRPTANGNTLRRGQQPHPGLRGSTSTPTARRAATSARSSRAA